MLARHEIQNLLQYFENCLALSCSGHLNKQETLCMSPQVYLSYYCSVQSVLVKADNTVFISNKKFKCKAVIKGPVDTVSQY